MHGGRKHFCRHCLQAFSTEEISKHQIKDCFKINGKERDVMPKNKHVKFKNYERKIKLPFIVCADFESILVSEHNVKAKPKKASHKQISKIYCLQLWLSIIMCL